MKSEGRKFGEIPGTGPKSPVIHLDRLDLAHLLFLRKFSSGNAMPDPRKALTIPRRIIDTDLQSTLDKLEGGGRVKNDLQIPRNILAPSKSGNVVVRPVLHDESVLAAFSEVSPVVLTSILEFAEVEGKRIKSIDLLPNLSASRLKGVAIQFDQTIPKWWQDMSPYLWPIGRGINTVALPIRADEFIDKHESLLPIVEKIGRASQRALKWARFYYSGDEQVFLAISSGSTQEERLGISSELGKIHRPGQVKNFVSEVLATLNNRRMTLIKTILQEIGIPEGGELICEEPIVRLDIERGLAVSGGVGLEGSLHPYTRKEDGLLIYRSEDREIKPLGLKRIEKKGNTPIFFNEDDVLAFERSLKTELELRDLAVGYHESSK